MELFAKTSPLATRFLQRIGLIPMSRTLENLLLNVVFRAMEHNQTNYDNIKSIFLDVHGKNSEDILQQQWTEYGNVVKGWDPKGRMSRKQRNQIICDFKTHLSSLGYAYADSSPYYKKWVDLTDDQFESEQRSKAAILARKVTAEVKKWVQENIYSIFQECVKEATKSPTSSDTFKNPITTITSLSQPNGIDPMKNTSAVEKDSSLSSVHEALNNTPDPSTLPVSSIDDKNRYKSDPSLIIPEFKSLCTSEQFIGLERISKMDEFYLSILGMTDLIAYDIECDQRRRREMDWKIEEKKRNLDYLYQTTTVINNIITHQKSEFSLNPVSSEINMEDFTPSKKKKKMNLINKRNDCISYVLPCAPSPNSVTVPQLQLARFYPIVN